MLIKIRKAQSTLEYALLIAVVVGALLAMQTYLKRSIQGRMQIIGDQMGDQYTPTGTYREENMTVNNEKILENTSVDATGNFSVGTEITGGFQKLTSYRTVENVEKDVWEKK